MNGLRPLCLLWLSWLPVVILTMGFWFKAPSELKTTGYYSAAKEKTLDIPKTDKSQNNYAELKKPGEKECIL